MMHGVGGWVQPEDGLQCRSLTYTRTEHQLRLIVWEGDWDTTLITFNFPTPHTDMSPRYQQFQWVQINDYRPIHFTIYYVTFNNETTWLRLCLKSIAVGCLFMLLEDIAMLSQHTSIHLKCILTWIFNCTPLRY